MEVDIYNLNVRRLNNKVRRNLRRERKEQNLDFGTLREFLSLSAVKIIST